MMVKVALLCALVALSAGAVTAQQSFPTFEGCEYYETWDGEFNVMGAGVR